MPKKPATKRTPKVAVKESLPPAIAQDMRSVMALAESWGDLVNPREAYAWDNYSIAEAFVARDDFGDGRFRPFYDNEYDLQRIWAAGRWLASGDAGGAGMLRALTDYTIGTGMTYAVTDHEGNPLPMFQEWLDNLQEEIGWTGELEREIHDTTETHGDGFLWLEDHRTKPIVGVTTLAPEWITEPTSKDLGEDYEGLCWRFGVGSQPNRAKEVEGYFASINGKAADYEVISKDRMIHVKRNAPSWAKRGLSTFYPAINLLKEAAKVFENALKGGAIQAAIAYIVEMAPGVTQGQAQNFISGNATGTQDRRTSSGGTTTQYTRKFAPGSVIATGSGQKYHAGPMGSPSGPLFVELVQAALRLAGASRGLPEYMISGDASNANYASTMVAGSPFVKAIEHAQTIYKAAFHRLFWRMMQIAVLKQRFARRGIYTLGDLKRAVRLTVTPTAVVLGDPRAQEEIRKIRKEAGVLSVKTWQKQVDLDPAEEAENIAAEPKPEPPPIFGAPPLPGQRPMFGDPMVRESQSVPWWECRGSL